MSHLSYRYICLALGGLLLAVCCASTHAQGYSLVGQVKIDRWHGLSGVTVTLSGDAVATTVTGADGAFEFPALPDGRYRVTPAMPGYEFDPPFQNLHVTGADLTAETTWAYTDRPHMAESIIMRFLPPLGEEGASTIGDFDATADVAVVVSLPNGLPFFAFAKDSGLDRITVDTTNHEFSLDWRTDRADVYPWLTTGVIYRLSVVKSSKPAGYVDIVFGTTEEEARSYATERTYAAALGTVVPVRFRLDKPPYDREVAYERLKRFLVTHDPDRGDAGLREHSITVLDELHKADPIGWPPVFEPSTLDFYRFVMDRALTQVASEPVDATAAIWRGYSLGYIVKTPGLTFAQDMTDYDWLPDFDARLAPLVEVLTVSHWHPDHYEPAFAQAVAAAGGEVVGTPDIDDRTITLMDGQQVALPSMSIWAHFGAHSAYNLQYEVTTSDGLHLIHTGDTDYGNILNGTGEPVDLLLYTVWYFAPRLRQQAEVLKPGCIIPGHMQELAREWAYRVSYANAFGAGRMVNTPQFPVMTWGERYLYRRGNLPPICRPVVWSPERVAGSPISFRAQARDWDGTVTSITWTFGDGETGAGEMLDHTFARPGTYVIATRVVDDQSASGGSWILVEVDPAPPTCAITYSPETPRAASPIEFDSHAADPDGEIASVAWSLGDGATTEGAVIAHTYGQRGTYDVTCTVTDGDGLTVTCQRTVVVENALPTCDPIWSPETPIAGETVAFDAQADDPDGTVVSVDWDFGDGATASGEQAEHTFQAAGTYAVTCTVTDNDGETATCGAEMEVGWACQADVAIAFAITPRRARAGRRCPVLVVLRNLGPDSAMVRVAVSEEEDGPPIAEATRLLPSRRRALRPVLLWPVVTGEPGTVLRLNVSVEPIDCGDPDPQNNRMQRAITVIGAR